MEAFDEVPHDGLIVKLQRLGVIRCLLQVLTDYFKGRRHFVIKGNTKSTKLDNKSDVPQGSDLGLLLFCIFINDLPSVFKSSYCLMFADDLKFLTINAAMSETILHLKRLQNWTTENWMEIAKMKNIFIKFKGSHSMFVLNDKQLLSDAYMKDLGVNICPEFSWSYRVNEKSKQQKNPLFHTEDHGCKNKDILQIESVQDNDNADAKLCFHLHHAIKKYESHY